MSKEELSYRGSQDVVRWLRETCPGAPVLHPYWVTGTFPVFIEFSKPEDGCWYLGIVLNRWGMQRETIPGRLWFCGIPAQELLANTSADPKWFQPKA
jgi:hypothetical protein